MLFKCAKLFLYLFIFSSCFLEVYSRSRRVSYLLARQLALGEAFLCVKGMSRTSGAILGDQF